MMAIHLIGNNYNLNDLVAFAQEKWGEEVDISKIDVTITKDGITLTKSE